MSKSFPIGWCILCGFVHPQTLSCAEVKARQATAEQNADRADVLKQKWLNRLMKWRTVFVGRLLGSRLDTDVQCQAVRDHLEMLLSLRVEMNALTKLLIEAGIITPEKFTLQVEAESEHLCGLLEKRFPGFRACDTGIQMDVKLALETTKGWPK